MAESPVTNREQIAILDFGSQYSHLIARRVRGECPYSVSQWPMSSIG